MQIDTNQIIEMLHGMGKHEQAAQVRNTFADKVDTENQEHRDLLSKLGINLDDFENKLGGLGNLL